MLITNWLVDDVTPCPGNHRVMRDAADRVTKLLGYISAEVAAIDMQARADAPPCWPKANPKRQRQQVSRTIGVKMARKRTKSAPQRTLWERLR